MRIRFGQLISRDLVVGAIALAVLALLAVPAASAPSHTRAVGFDARSGRVFVAAADPSGGRVIRVASLRVTLPAGWTWAQERGGYRDCSNPIVKLWAASYRLPRGFGTHEGPLVVRAGQVLLVIVARPIRSSSTLWKRWRVTNAKLHPAVPADGSRYKTQLTFPSTPAVGATLWAGSRRLSTRMLRLTNRLLASLSVDPRYGCR